MKKITIFFCFLFFIILNQGCNSHTETQPIKINKTFTDTVDMRGFELLFKTRIKNIDNKLKYRITLTHIDSLTILENTESYKNFLETQSNENYFKVNLLTKDTFHIKTIELSQSYNSLINTKINKDKFYGIRFEGEILLTKNELKEFEQIGISSPIIY